MGKLFENQTVAYFVKAILLVVCLMLVSWVAPHMPSVLLPLFFIAYTAISTIGALYYTVINRLHRQKKLADAGNLSKLNRKWVWRMVGILVVAIISGFFFVLESPKWDGYEWLLIWIAIPLYFGVFRFLQHQLKKEYAPKFYKAHAMRWSFWIVGVILCAAYAIITSLLTSQNHYETLAAAFDAVQEPYQHAPSVLMGEIEGVSSLADGLTAYGIGQFSDDLIIVGIIFKAITYASVFFGLVSQFGFCLLDLTEIKSEFQILPSYDEDDSSGPVLPRYLIAGATVVIVTYVAFLCTEFEFAKVRATGEYTFITEWVDENKGVLIDLADGAYADMKDWHMQKEASIQAVETVLVERNDQLTPLINEYYDQCLSNIDPYLDWYYGPAGTVAKLMKPFGNPMAGMAKDAFLEQIKAGVDDGSIMESYAEYQEKLRALQEESSAILTVAEVGALFGGSDDDTLNLWAPLEDPSNVNDVLLNTEEGVSREDMQDKVGELIEWAREDSLSKIKYEN